MEDIQNLATNDILFDGRYKLLRPLSSDGGTADVWLALDTNTIDEVYDEEDDRIVSVEDSGIKVAIKIYRPSTAIDFGEQLFRKEFKIVFNCHHSNLVQPINFSIYEGTPYLVLPYCQNGSSEKLQGKKIDDSEIWRYIRDVSAGLAYLHSFTPTIVHHDIKPANILIDDNNNFAITDFGISSHRGLTRDEYDETHSGTIAYMAPERFKESYESIPESDIWSFGATLYELITGSVPFGEEGGLSQLKSGKQNAPQISQDIPNDIKNLISDCLSLDIAKRPSAELINKAAAVQRYPLKNTTKNIIIGCIVGGIVSLALLFLVLSNQNKQVPEEHIKESIPAKSNQEIYEDAMKYLESSDVIDLKKGLSILDSLGNANYVPALYQQAFTYGWYSDSISVSRKETLGIEYYPKGTNEAWLPKSQQINAKAIGLFSRIEELNDPNYPNINANALYRLACYYVNDLSFASSTC